VFRAARRRDWRFVLGCHAWAAVLSGLVLVGLCVPESREPATILLPHLFYWTLVSIISLQRVLAWLFLFTAVLLPTWFYRGVCYYRYAGSNALLEAALRGRWAGEPWYARARAAIRLSILPTWLLVRQGVPAREFEAASPAFRLPSKALFRVLLTLAISLNQLPFIACLNSALCLNPTVVIGLPSWAGRCSITFGSQQPSNWNPCTTP
jgi:hypothetical protein